MPSCPIPLHGLLKARTPYGVSQLVAYASTNSEWTSFYVDYKALKQILRQLSPTDVENQTEGNAQVRGARARRAGA